MKKTNSKEKQIKEELHSSAIGHSTGNNEEISLRNLGEYKDCVDALSYNSNNSRSQIQKITGWVDVIQFEA